MAGVAVELAAANSQLFSSGDNQLSSSEPGGGTTFFLQMAGVTVELDPSVNALPAMREARKVSPPEDDGGDEADAVPRPADDADDGAEKVDVIPQPTDAEDAVPRPADDADDGAEKVDAIPRPTDAENDVPRPADDADDGAEKVDAIPRPIDAEDDAEPVPGAAVLVPERKLIRVVRERRAS